MEISPADFLDGLFGLGKLSIIWKSQSPGDASSPPSLAAQEVNSEVSLFEAVLQLFHATDPAVVLGYAGEPGGKIMVWGPLESQEG